MDILEVAGLEVDDSPDFRGSVVDNLPFKSACPLCAESIWADDVGDLLELGLVLFIRPGLVGRYWPSKTLWAAIERKTASCTFLRKDFFTKCLRSNFWASFSVDGGCET